MTASAVLTALIVGAALSIWQAIRATQAESLAQSRLEAEKRALHQAEANLQEARRAEREKTEKLAFAYFKEAQAKRWSGRAGRRFESLDLLKMAAELYRGLDQLDAQRLLEVRNEAIACLTLADLTPGKEWRADPAWSPPQAFGSRLQYYAVRSAVDGDPLNPKLHRGELSVRRVADDREVVRLPGFGVRVVDARFSPDGRFLAAHYEMGARHNYVWDLSRGAAVLKLPHGIHPECRLAFSPDSRRVALPQPDESIRIWELPTGAKWQDVQKDVAPNNTAPKAAAPDSQARVVQFHPDGRRLTVVQGKLVRLRDLDKGKDLATFKLPSDVCELVWRDDGKMFAASCFDNHIYLWDAGNAAEPRRVLKGHLGLVTRLAFTFGGDLLFSSGWDRTNRLWDAMTGQELLNDNGASSMQHQFAADDLELDYGRKLAPGRECRTFHGAKRVKWAALSPRGRLAATASAAGVQLWDLAATREGDKLLVTLAVGGCARVHFDPKGENLFTEGKNAGLQRWPISEDPASGGLKIGPPAPLGLSAQERARMAAYDPQFALSGAGRVAQNPQRGQVFLFDLDNPAQKVRIESPFLRAAVFSPDGRWLATGNWQGRDVKVWDAGTGELVVNLDLGAKQGRVAVPAFSPDGKWLVTGDFEEYRFWEVGSWKKHHGLVREDSERFGPSIGWSVFAPQTEMVALLQGTGLLLLDPLTLRAFARLPTRGSPACFSPDGSQLVTYVGDSDAFQVWDLRLIRRQLAELGLDWDLPPYPAPEEGPGAKGPMRVRMIPG
jgi:WD40 repeat protein